MTFIDNKVTSLVITIDDVTKEVSLPNTKESIAFSLVLGKYDTETVVDIVTNDSANGEMTERLVEYRAWYAKCNKAVEELDIDALNAAAETKIESDRKAEEEKRLAEEEEARKEAERLAAEEEAQRIAEEEERRKEEERLAPKRAFESAKSAKLAAIAEYDKSENVNSFSVCGIEGWLDRDTRTSLTNTVTVEKAAGKEETTLWFGLNKLTLNCDLVLGMLAQLEMYAHECYNNTAQHIANVTAIEPVGDEPDYALLKEMVDEYDHTAGYPAHPVF